MTEEKISEPAAVSVLRMIQEARDIASGRSEAAPKREHLEALLVSAMFYKARAAELEQQHTAQLTQSHGKGEMFHIAELESACYQCEARAEYVLAGVVVPVLFCPAHARQQPQWKGRKS